MIETASFGRRLLAFIVDSSICAVLVILIVGYDDYLDSQRLRYLALPAYVLESTILTWLAGGSLGKLLTGLCVVPADGALRRLRPLKVLGRQILAVLIIPVLVFREDGRGLHDLFAGTSTVTFATLRTLVK